MMRIKCPVFIVVSDAKIRRHLVKTLRAEGYPSTPFANGSDFLEALTFLPPGVALVEMQLPEKNGMLVLEQLRAQRKDIPLIMTSACADIRKAVQAIKKGADDFIDQPFSEDQLFETIEQASSLLPSRAEWQQRKDQAETCLQSLTKREIDILRALEINKSNQVTADQLRLSVRTVETYRSRIMKKCGVTKFADVISTIGTAGFETINDRSHKKR